MTTKREYLQNLLNKFKQDIIQYFDYKLILPFIENCSIEDLLFLLSFSASDNSDFTEKYIKDTLKDNNIVLEEDKFKEAYDLFITFLTSFKNV